MTDYNLTLDIYKDRGSYRSNGSKAVAARVGDVGSQRIIAQLTDHGEPYTPTGVTCRLEMQRVNGEWVRADAALTGSTVTVVLPDAAVSEGDNWQLCYFSLINAGGTVVDTTESFPVLMLPNVDITAEEAQAYQSRIDALLAEIDAWLQVDSTAVHTIEANGRVLSYKDADGTVLGTVETQDTTYSKATTEADGLMSKEDKLKLDGVRVSALEYDTLQWLVQNNLHAQFFSVGDKLTIDRTSGSYVADIIGIDHDGTPSLTLGFRDCVASMQFSAPQMIWGNTRTEPLPAGTYYITLLNGAYNDSTAEDGNYQITTTQPIPVGGGIGHSAMGKSRAYGQSYVTAGKWTTYGADRVAIESNLACTIGSTGTSLGTATCSDSTKLVSTVGTMNYTQRNFYGSNKYAESAVRLWMNSAAASNYWAPQGAHDLPPSNSADAGFKYDLDPEFLAMLGSVEKLTQQGRPEGSVLATSEEVFFLPSYTEVYFTGGAEGAPYDWYVDFSDTPASAHTTDDTNRVKRSGGSPVYWWLRSAAPSGAGYVYFVRPSGSLNSTGAVGAGGIAPCCVIK